METVNVNLAHRWFIGYDLTETVPDHSSLSKIRDRYGLAIFQRFFKLPHNSYFFNRLWVCAVLRTAQPQISESKKGLTTS